jgi:uncharacterized protein YdcH (DUF465 family)
LAFCIPGIAILFVRRSPSNPHPHGENAVFPEYRDLITQLKTTDSHFLNVYEKHNELDQRIRNMESGIEPATHLAIEALKKEKLALKDELYQTLRKASA